MVAPLAPHIAEELWRRLGHDESLAYAAVPGRPTRRCWWTSTVTCVVQVNGKVRDRLEVPPVDRATTSCARWRWPSEAVQRALDGREVRTVVVRAPSW